MSEHIKIHENYLFEDDVEDVNRLIRQVSSTAKPVDWEIIKAVMDNGTIFILRDHSPEALKKNPNGIVIGKTVLNHVRKLTGFFGLIQDVVVDENYRGKGLGKQLTKEVINKGKELGMKYIDLTSRPSRESANNLYKSLGFEVRDTNYYRLHL